MIGIGVKRTSGGGAQFVTTTYLDSFEETLAAGFTCASGYKYKSDQVTIDNMWSRYWIAKESATTIKFDTYDYGLTTDLTAVQAYQDLVELTQNLYNARVYDSYIY